ncbi:MAG: hypothetical protein ACF8NJ_07425, partial [Phycisphaerales bacterium JB038]
SARSTPGYSRGRECQADLEFMVTRLPDYDEETARNITSFFTACLELDPERPDTLCLLSLQESTWQMSGAVYQEHAFTAAISPRGEAMGPFLDKDGRSLTEAVQLPEPQLIALDLPRLQQARDVVDALGDQILDLESATRRLRDRDDLSVVVRETAEAVLRMRFPDAAVTEVRRIVDRPGREPSEYARALSLAQQAAAMRPHDWPIHTALGIAQYRTAETPGQFEEALRTLRFADQSNHRRPARVATMALVMEQLGRHKEALEELARMTDEIRLDGPYAHSGQELVEESRRLLGGAEP